MQYSLSKHHAIATIVFSPYSLTRLYPHSLVRFHWPNGHNYPNIKQNRQGIAVDEHSGWSIRPPAFRAASNAESSRLHSAGPELRQMTHLNRVK
jgi:hypothetical protein